MKKIYLSIILAFLCLIKLFPNEAAINFNPNFNIKNTLYENTSNIFLFPFSSYQKISEMDLTLYDEKEKINIFDKPDMSWIKEKNRLEKLFIAIGVVSFAIGFSMFLAGLLNLVIPNDAVSIDGKPITNVQGAYIAITAVGGGLMASGIPFIIVGSIKLGLAKKKEKEESAPGENPSK